LNLLRDAYDGDLSAMVRPMLVCLAIGAAFGVLASFRLSRGWGRSHLL
jgi:ABC-2 type transport system permease protein